MHTHVVPCVMQAQEAKRQAEKKAAIDAALKRAAEDYEMGAAKIKQQQEAQRQKQEQRAAAQAAAQAARQQVNNCLLLW